MFSVRLSHLAAIRDVVNRKSDSRFKYVCASLSNAPLLTRGTKLCSALLQTVLAICKEAQALPPP